MRHDENHWPLMPYLPSYGYGRERAGPRYGSLIYGQNMRDVVITCEIICMGSSSEFSVFFLIVFQIHFFCCIN